MKERERISLKEIHDIIGEKEDSISTLIPDVHLFKEIMVELVKSREIQVKKLQREKKEYVVEQTLEFQLQEMLLTILEEDPKKADITGIFVSRIAGAEPVTFSQVKDGNGKEKIIRCSDLEFRIER